MTLNQQLFFILGLFSIFLVPEIAFAADPKPLAGTAKAIYELLTGDTARIVAAIALIGAAMLGYFGILAIKQILTVVISIAVVWGSTAIVAWIRTAAA